MRYYSVLVVFLCLFLSGCIGVSVFDENGFENITFKINSSAFNISGGTTNISLLTGARDDTSLHTVRITDNDVLRIAIEPFSVNDGIWERSAGIVNLTVPATLVNITADEVFISGNLSVNEITIRSNDSIFFFTDHLVKISAADEPCPICGPNISRRQLETDADFQSEYANINGTTFLTGQNLDLGPLSRTNVGSVNDAGLFFGFTKKSFGAEKPAEGQLINAGGDFTIMNGPTDPFFSFLPDSDTLKLGFWGGITFRQDLSWQAITNQSFNIVLHRQNTTFNKPVIFNASVISNLTVEGTLFANDVYGYSAFFDPFNGNITFTGIGVFTNVHGFNLIFPYFVYHICSTLI